MLIKVRKAKDWFKVTRHYLIEVLEHFVRDDELLFDHVTLTDFLEDDAFIGVTRRIADSLDS